MTINHQGMVRDNYNAIAKRVAEEQFALHPDWEFDPAQLAHHTNRLIDELKRQRDEAQAVIREVDSLSVLSSTVRFMEQAMDITGRYLYPQAYAEAEQQERPHADD